MYLFDINRIFELFLISNILTILAIVSICETIVGWDWRSSPKVPITGLVVSLVAAGCATFLVVNPAVPGLWEQSVIMIAIGGPPILWSAYGLAVLYFRKRA